MPSDNQPVIDSALTEEEAKKQNPESLAPEEVRRAQRVLPVSYYGFDGVLHEGQLVMHEELAEDVQAFFALARELTFPIEKVIPICVPDYAWNDDRSCDDNNTAGWNYRLIAGTDRVSKHAFGRAFDVNPVQNPYIRYDAEEEEVFRAPEHSRYDERAAGTLAAAHPLVGLLKSRGWTWGGDWTPASGRIDYQHFEKAG